MDSYANTPHSNEHAPTPIFFPSVFPVGQSSTYQTSISHPINIPCPPYPIPGILTPPDTPTSPFGFAMKQQLPTGTPTEQNVSFCVSTAYDSSAQTNDGGFVRAGKSLLRKKNNLSLRPGLRLNTNLEVQRHVHPVQETVSDEKVVAELCNEIGAELCNEIEAEMCGEIGAEMCDEIEAELCNKIEAEMCGEIGAELCDEFEAELCNEIGAEMGDEVVEELCHELDGELEGIELESCAKTQEDESSDVDMATYVGRESPVEKDRERELRLLCFIGSDLRKIADQFQATYTRVDWMLRNGSLNFTLSTAITGCLSISMMCLAI